MIRSATRYLDLGLSVFPVGPDKHPRIAWKAYQTTRPTLDDITGWWQQYPEANIGCATGAISGLVVLDADTPAARDDLVALLPADLITWRSRTGRDGGGWQFFFAHPGEPLANRAGLRPGLDVRGDGGYVILPPSVHASGRRYDWEISPKYPLAPLPPALLSLLRTPPPPPASVNGTPGGGVIGQGQRNAEVHRLARSLYSKGLAEAEVLAALLTVNRDRCVPPLPVGEVHQIVHHAATEPHRADFGTVTAPPWNSTLLEIQRVGSDYHVRSGSAHLAFRSLTSHHDGPTAIVEALDHAVGGRPHIDRLALLSSRTRESLAKSLARRWPGHAWSDILDDAAVEIYRSLVAGTPPEPLAPVRPSPDAWLIEDLMPLEQTTVLYADGGSLKSYFALALAVAGLRNEPVAPDAPWCVRQLRSVLFVDWETEKRTHEHRLWRILKGLDLDPGTVGAQIHYMNMIGRPLAPAVQGVTAQAVALGTDLTILDSLGGATGGGEGIETSAAIATLAAIGALPGTKLVLHHVTNASAVTQSGSTRPYGSTYIRNLARSTIEARAEPDGHDTLVTYLHTKANDARLRSPLAIRYSFSPTNDAVTLYSASPDLQHAALGARVLAALEAGPKTVASLAEELGHSETTIRVELNRCRKRGKAYQCAEDAGGRGKKALWELVDTKRIN